MFGMTQRIAAIESQIKQCQVDLNAAQTQAASLFQHGLKQAQKIDGYYSSQLSEHTLNVQAQINQQPLPNIAGWNSNAWQTFTPDKTNMESIIRVGDFVEQRTKSFSVPAYAPFIGGKSSIVIRCGGPTVMPGLELLQSLVMRTAMMLPHQSFYTLLDPAGARRAFPMLRQLPQVRPADTEVYRDLEQVWQDIERINVTYLDATTTSFESIEPEMRINERFQFVFAADFPNRYDRRAIEALQRIGHAGNAAGVYLFIHHNVDHDLPRDISMDKFTNAFTIDLTKATYPTPSGYVFRPDSTPEPKLQEKLGNALRSVAPPVRILDWDETVGIREKTYWRGSASEKIETPVGRSSGSESLNVWFGVKDDVPCAHGMLGAMTGSGKSNFYHTLICGFATRYSPSELRFYLIDGKNGVEFEPYQKLPHTEVVSLRSPAELSRSVLADLVAEKNRRDALFRRASVPGFIEYRKKGQPLGNLPRILLFVDEYQHLFEDDRNGNASNYLLQLGDKGRSAGIHMLLASQRFGVVGMLNQTQIFSNMHLRIAMKMTAPDVQALTEFGRRGKGLIATCDIPGKLVLNDKGGDDAANHAGKVAFLSKERRQEIIDRLVDRAQSLSQELLPQRTVLDGEAQPLLRDNSEFTNLLHQPRWCTIQQLEAYARKPQNAGGLDIAEWYASEHQYVTWLGKDFSVRGQVKIILRRGHDEHAMLLGGNNAGRYGMVAAMLLSLSVNLSPAETQFIVVDCSIPGTQWSHVLPTICERVLQPAGYKTYYTKDGKHIEVVLNKLLQMLSERQSYSEEQRADLSDIFILMTDLERIDKLRRRSDTYGYTESELGEKLLQVCREGAAYGIHLIMSFSGVGAMNAVLDKKQGLMHFRHRVALQMSEDDAFTFMGDRKPSLLQKGGDIPVCALYKDMQYNKDSYFKPYSTEPEEILQEQIADIANELPNRSKR